MECGGRLARQGFDFQDHVAAAICLDMLEDERLHEVWCESQDDVTLLWQVDGLVTVEFVQVKSADMQSRWSVAEITRSEGKRNKRKLSLLEQSLSRANCREPTRFRIVSFTDVTHDLAVLKAAIGSHRDPAKLALLQAKLQKRGLMVKASANGTTLSQWAERCFWETKESNDAQANSNRFRFERYVKERLGMLLSVPQVFEIYTLLLEKVKFASGADLSEYPDAHKIKRNTLQNWVKEAVDQVVFKGPGVQQNKMRAKMARCGISAEVIDKAVLLRLAYVTERVNAGYSTVTPLTRLETKVLARMQIERVALEMGAISDSGPEFHLRCLQALEAERAIWAEKFCPDSASFQGYLYELTNRCQHSFDLVK